MRVPVCLFPAILALLLLPGLNLSASPIPPGSEATVLRLLSPYGVDAPADKVGDAVIESVAVGPDVITIGLRHGDASVELLMGSRDTAPSETVEETESFDLWVSAPPADPALQVALDRIAEAVRTNDSGTFWDEIPVPESWREATVTEVQDAGPPLWSRYLGEFLLLVLVVLLVLTARHFLPSLKGRKWFVWVGVAAFLALGTSYRFMPEPAPLRLPEQKPVESSACDSESQCDDHTPCTVDRCNQSTCQHEWAPPPDTEFPCCRTDADCNPAGTPGQQVFCSPKSFLCTIRVNPPPAGAVEENPAKPPLSAAIGWLYGIPARFMGQSFDTVRQVNLALSAFSILLLALVLMVWGAGNTTVLAATFLYAVLPASIVTAQTTSMTGTLLTLGLLLALGFAPLAAPSPPALSPPAPSTIPPALLCGVLLFILGAARLEALLLAVPMAALLLAGRRYRSVGLPAIGILAGFWLVSLIFRLAVFSLEQTAAQFPPLSGSPVDDFLATGAAIVGAPGAFPYLLVVLALAGIVPAFKRNPRLLTLTGLVFLAAPAVLLAFSMTLAEAVRNTLVPGMALVVWAGFGVEWLTDRKRGLRFVWLVATIIAVYLAVSPCNELAELNECVKTHEIWLPYSLL